ncbi:putative exocyst complex component sec5 [Golovinomyces cichoracearum]|uniref:Exocyst complex component SEC5 n=1 Tax=Golovinomyces cichoracearum TaxID=62708 RepID=A0A420IE79_9PEZI|nr:putative exocyst complex component sec5 [Golovinomyces cichoracearum]
MTDNEFSVHEHYQLTSPFPTEWPEEKDNDDHSDDDDNETTTKNRPKSKPRYSALVTTTGNRKSFMKGSLKAESAIENLLQRDEPDSLGTTDSVVGTLKNLGLPVQDDIRLRNKFLLSSTTFSPSLFLSQVHSTASTQDLLNGLNVLSQSIDQKSASLKVLVESNFERFVRAKATIDNVYKEMKFQGDEPPPSSSRPRAHSRHASRNSFRNSSSNQATVAVPNLDGKKKNALAKETEYGVLGIKTQLLDVSAKAEEVWGPALGGHEKENNIRLMLTSIEQFQDLYRLSASISESIKRKDYEAVFESYNKAKQFADDAKILSEKINMTAATELQKYQIILAAHVWTDVRQIIEEFKRDIWRKLIKSQCTSLRKDEANGTSQDQHIDYIEILLELGATENPILVWLTSCCNYLKSKIQSISDRSKIEIEILRRQILNGDRPTNQIKAIHLKSLERHTGETKLKAFDSSEVIEFWERVNKFMSNILSIQNILGEVVQLGQTVQNLINGKAKRMFTSNSNQNSLDYHRLSKEEASELQKETYELLHMIRESVSGFFLNLPIDDISSLFSPMPLTPQNITHQPRLSPMPSVFLDSPMSRATDNLHPSLKGSEVWDEFAFWPPWSNAISAVHYLGKFLALVGSAANEMAALLPDEQGDESFKDQLRSFVSSIRERCIIAVCAAWIKDAEDIKVLENWLRSPENKNLTKVPIGFSSFGNYMLSGMQKMLYIPEALVKTDSVNIVTPPSSKILQMVRSQFVTTIYKSLTGLVENAENPVQKSDDDWTPNLNVTAISMPIASATSLGPETVDSSDRNVRILLTLSNMQALCDEAVPSLIVQFENSFSVKMTDESKVIKDFLDQMNARLFSSFTQPYIDSICGIIHAGITSPNWAPSEKPLEARPYVYEVLLSLVLLHAQVSTTTSSLTVKILSFVLEKISQELLDSLKLRSQWKLPDLMQATLDVEFISQTLSQYTSEKASEIQSKIYQELDNGTDIQSRAELQTELPGMRTVLKTLRDRSKIEFACFKKGRSRSERSRPSNIAQSQLQENN